MISVVAPLYNEQEVIRESYKRLTAVLNGIGEDYELIFVNDGSRDDTAAIVRELAEGDRNLKIISFSRNFGHQNAVSAGLANAAGDAVIVIDADLQDPPEVMRDMIAKWREGYEVVYGKRVKREGESVFKKVTATVFYRLLRSLTDTEMQLDANDFRLYDRKVADAMNAMPEHNRYLRGMCSWLGFKQIGVEFVRAERFAGQTHYTLGKMLKLASDGIFAFSHKPLGIGRAVGGLLVFAGIALAILEMIFALIGSPMFSEVASWAAAIIFAQGLTLLTIGIMGAYLARMYDESKGRPNYVIAERLNFKRSAFDRNEEIE